MSKVIDGNMLRAMREAKRWDQLTLARTAGINPSVVSRIERGLQNDLMASVLIALASALEVPVDALLHPSLHSVPTPLSAELAEIVAALAHLTPSEQKRIVAMLRAYVTTPSEG